MSLVDHISALLGVPTDQVSLLLCFVAAIPLGLIQNYYIKGELNRHLYSII